MKSFWINNIFVAIFIISLTSSQNFNGNKAKSSASNFYTYIERRHTEFGQNEAIKQAYMRDILKSLGMERRPPPIPLERRRENIPSPVYDGGINLGSQDAAREKKTQIVIAAEEGKDERCNDEGACFRFKINHALLHNYDINYAALHVYNEAAKSHGGVHDGFKTIRLKEIFYNTTDGGDDASAERRHIQSIDVEENGHGSDVSGTNMNNPDNFRDRESTGGSDSTEKEKTAREDENENGGYKRKMPTAKATWSGLSTNQQDDEEKIGKTKEIELIKREVFIQANQWFKIHIVEVVADWKKRHGRSANTHSLEVVCSHCESTLNICRNSRYRPFIVLKLTERKRRRKRRSYAMNCAPGYEKCCRRKLYINFKDINWQDWIIEPSGVEMNHCEGRCTGPGVISAKSHAFVKQKLTRHKFLKVCCVPIKFSPLTLLHFDETGLIHKTVLRDMIVEECGCV